MFFCDCAMIGRERDFHVPLTDCCGKHCNIRVYVGEVGVTEDFEVVSLLLKGNIAIFWD